MTVGAVRNPYATILNLSGSGLNDGDVYIGVAGMDPQTSPQAVYWDAAMTIPATQPLETSGGYIWRAGSPAKAYLANPYSIRVRDRFGAQVFYEPSVPLTPENIAISDVSGLQAALDAIPNTWYGAINSAGSLADGVGILSSSKVGTGQYSIILSQNAHPTKRSVQVALQSNTGTWVVAFAAANAITVITKDDAAVNADRSFFITVTSAK